MPPPAALAAYNGHSIHIAQETVLTAASPYTTRLAIPSIATYQQLRVVAGLSAKTAEAAAKGLPNSLFAVQVLHGDEVVGMGRVIGDGGCFYQVVDIAVLPAHQGKGLGKLIMREIRQFIDSDVPESAYVSLIADGQAQDLYAQFGFKHTAPASVGMALKR
ncbi:N-acetyltransferase [Janthinobacterium sp. BJB304]|nr:N-acetyltransferase [Janthinobacterium sp. BJB304]